MSSAIGPVAADREATFDTVIGPLIDQAFKLAFVYLRDRYEAEDAVQEATLSAWQGFDRLRDRSAARSWFLTIVANQCRSMRRSKWWSVLRLPSLPSSENPAVATEVRLDLSRELLQLSSSDRAALFLFFYLDLPLAEVGKVLKISPQAAKSRVHRALTRLRMGMLEVTE